MRVKTYSRLRKYPEKSEVQHKSGHVYVKDGEGKWRPRGRMLMQREEGRELKPNERVYHIDGNPSHDQKDNLVVITFSGTRYRLEQSRPVYIPEGSNGAVAQRRRP